MNTRQKGTEKEQIAVDYLEAHGMRISEQNFRSRQGEIDIIGYHEEYLVFVEVKFRSGKCKGSAIDAVDFRKQKQICKVADFYRVVHKLGMNTKVRYDVIAIQGEEIRWIRNAFPHIYSRG